jgi:hypothetical protein
MDVTGFAEASLLSFRKVLLERLTAVLDSGPEPFNVTHRAVARPDIPIGRRQPVDDVAKTLPFALSRP